MVKILLSINQFCEALGADNISNAGVIDGIADALVTAARGSSDSI